jgi:hypothetical protein
MSAGARRACDAGFTARGPAAGTTGDTGPPTTRSPRAISGSSRHSARGAAAPRPATGSAAGTATRRAYRATRGTTGCAARDHAAGRTKRADPVAGRVAAAAAVQGSADGGHSPSRTGQTRWALLLPTDVVLSRSSRTPHSESPILDIQLFPEERGLVRGLLQLGTKPATTHRTAMGIGEDDPGRGNRVQHARLDVLRPLPRDARREALRHGKLRCEREGRYRNIGVTKNPGPADVRQTRWPSTVPLEDVPW